MTEGATRFIAPDFLALTFGIVVYLMGVVVTQRVAVLRSFNIPEPVTGGFLAAIAIWLIYRPSISRLDSIFRRATGCW